MQELRARSCLACSDMHLSDDRPQLTDAFIRWLEGHTTNATHPPQVLLVLGDIFDAWIGDDVLAMAPPQSCAVKLTRALQSVAAGGIKVMLMRGNRDFLIGPSLAKACGAQLLDDSARLVIEDGPVVAITHGDVLCTRDTAYLDFRRMVRDANWQQSFLAKSIDERVAIARGLRDKSQSETAMKADDIIDVTLSECEAMATHLQANALLHGHTHRPGLSVMPNGMPRWVLPDWAMDDAKKTLVRGGGLWIDQRGATEIAAH